MRWPGESCHCFKKGDVSRRIDRSLRKKNRVVYIFARSCIVYEKMRGVLNTLGMLGFWFWQRS